MLLGTDVQEGNRDQVACTFGGSHVKENIFLLIRRYQYVQQVVLILYQYFDQECMTKFQLESHVSEQYVTLWDGTKGSQNAGINMTMLCLRVLFGRLEDLVQYRNMEIEIGMRVSDLNKVF